MISAFTEYSVMHRVGLGRFRGLFRPIPIFRKGYRYDLRTKYESESNVLATATNAAKPVSATTADTAESIPADAVADLHL